MHLPRCPGQLPTLATNPWQCQQPLATGPFALYPSLPGSTSVVITRCSLALLRRPDSRSQAMGYKEKDRRRKNSGLCHASKIVLSCPLPTFAATDQLRYAGVANNFNGIMKEGSGIGGGPTLSPEPFHSLSCWASRRRCGSWLVEV